MVPKHTAIAVLRSAKYLGNSLDCNLPKVCRHGLHRSQRWLMTQTHLKHTIIALMTFCKCMHTDLHAHARMSTHNIAIMARNALQFRCVTCYEVW